jgi:serine/threonine protein phosphatase PrpC
VNQDFHGVCVPTGALLARKGAALALADGISSSPVSQLASQAAVGSFLNDYYCTPDAWSVQRSVQRVVSAANSWLLAQTRRGQGRYDQDRGWACTFSALVVKSRTAHLFHVGDARIYQVQGRALEQLTTDHRVHVGGGQSYLGRALGIGAHLEIDHRSVALAVGDTFVLATDGVYEHVRDAAVVQALAAHADDLDAAARAIAQQALDAGSPDNLTVQLVRIERLPEPEGGELQRLAAELAFPPPLAPRMEIDGLRVARELHASSRSQVWLAVDLASDRPVVVKVPSTELQDDPGMRERFLLEEWVARRIDSAHVLKPCTLARERTHLFVAMEYVPGRTLAQWMVDRPRPDLETVRGLVGQLARGLRAFHRLEMLHQDLRPANVMVDAAGTVKIIDFGSVAVAGIHDAPTVREAHPLQGTAQYAAPEYFLGEAGTPRSDLFSLAVITYQLLCGQLPYGAEVARCKSRLEQRRLRYRSLAPARPDLPRWVDEALRKALAPEPHRRWEDPAEFEFALRHPDPAFLARRHVPLAERSPTAFWKGISLLLALACVALVAALAHAR